LIASCVCLVDFHGQVPETRGRQLGTELRLVVLVGELEERQAGTVADIEETVGVGTQLAEQVRLLGPGGDERKPMISS
jgi:hypothetical protein